MRCLLDDFRAPAMSVIHRALATANLGADHADEAFSQAMFKFQQVGLERFAGRAAPRTYFIRMALNCTVDVMRRMSRHTAKSETSVQDAEAVLANGSLEEQLVDREEQLERTDLLRAMSDCVGQLADSYRRPVVLYYLEQAGSCEACAEQLGMAKLTFMQRLSRARKKLALCLRSKLRQLEHSF